MSKKSKVDVKQLLIVLASGVAGVAGVKLLKDNSKSILKDDKIRNMVAPGAVIVGAIVVGMKEPKAAIAATAVTAGAGVMLAGGILDYFDRTKTKNDILGLAGDDDGVIVLNGEAELLAYAKALNPQLPEKEIKRQIENTYTPEERQNFQVRGDEDDQDEISGSLFGDEDDDVLASAV